MILLALAAAIIVPAGQQFTCSPTMVYDGDGPVWCAEGPRLRIAGIAAREMDGTCRGNQPCPDASAEEARDALVELLGKPAGMWRDHVRLKDAPALRCLSTGQAVGSRTGAWCTGPQGDISCRMVASRTVLPWRQYWNGHRCGR
jgi:hypothetical protein